MKPRLVTRMPVDRDVEAVEWVLRLRRPDLSEAEVTAWMVWCEADVLNRTAFEAMEEVWRVTGGLDAADVAVAKPAARARHASRAPRIAIWAVGMAALVAAAIFAVPLVWRQAPLPELRAGTDARLETARGRMANARLDDGSEVELGALSALTVRYTPQTRLIIADQGEAFFKVRKDRARPFVVQAGAVTVTAVGTAFSVTREENSVEVAVTEGVVEVRASPNLAGAEVAAVSPASINLAAGQRVRFDQGKVVQPVERVDPVAVKGWQTGRLEFRDEPLRLAVARVSRYVDRDITISDPSIADLRVTGTAYPDRVDSWLAGIESVLPVKVERSDDKHVLIRPKGRKSPR